MIGDSGFLARIRRALGGGRSRPNRNSEPTMIACDEALARLYEFLDEELPHPSAAEVETHFKLCAGCRPRLLFEKSFLQALRDAEDGQSLSEDLRHRVLQALESESAEG